MCNARTPSAIAWCTRRSNTARSPATPVTSVASHRGLAGSNGEVADSLAMSSTASTERVAGSADPAYVLTDVEGIVGHPLGSPGAASLRW